MTDDHAPRTRKRNSVEIADEKVRCLDLRRKGYSVREIADALGMARSTVQDRLSDAIAELVLPAADGTRLLELERLDAWQYALERRMDDGEDPVRVIPVCLRVQDQRARLLGLYAPVQVAATVHEVDEVDAELAELLAKARAVSDAREAAIRCGEDVPGF